MELRGTKILDPVLQTNQVDWLMVSIRDCPDAATEQLLIAQHFRQPHEPWAPVAAFVLPVIVRRSRRRVLFRQQSGVDDAPVRRKTA